MTCPEEEKYLCGSDGITYRYLAGHAPAKKDKISSS
jgi:hypothetical protein